MTDEPLPTATSSDDFFRDLDIQLLIHELKSPLSLIEASTRTLLQQPARLGSLTDRQERTLQRILRGAVRGRRLVNHLLEIGGAEASQFNLASFAPAEAVLEVMLEAVETTDGELAGRLAEAIDSGSKIALLTQAGIHLAMTPDARLLQIHQDRSKFELILSNLVQNALHFRKSLVAIDLHEEGRNVVVVVKDDGPGIAPEHHALVFERYKQLPNGDPLERQGHGLGLAGALILARRLGGDVTLESVPGHGATFALRIPRNAVQAPGN
jgi:two-component system, OmpR family, sensor kinase